MSWEAREREPQTLETKNQCVWDEGVDMNRGVLAMIFPFTSCPGFRGFLRPPLVGMPMVAGLRADGRRQASGRGKGARV